MARTQEIILVPSDGFIELTNDDVTAITFQVVEGTVEIRRAVALPADPQARGFRYEVGQGERNIPLDDLSGAAGARVFGTSRTRRPAKVIVDHA